MVTMKVKCQAPMQGIMGMEKQETPNQGKNSFQTTLAMEQLRRKWFPVFASFRHMRHPFANQLNMGKLFFESICCFICTCRDTWKGILDCRSAYLVDPVDLTWLCR